MHLLTQQRCPRVSASPRPRVAQKRAALFDELHFHYAAADAPRELSICAVGEPPLMYGIGAYFAIRNAIKAFTDVSPSFDAPFTAEKVLMSLYEN